MKYIATLGLGLSVSACSVADLGIELYRGDLPREERQKLFDEDLARAEKFVTKEHVYACMEAFKVTMHDPDSFEIVSLPVLDKFGSGYTWGKSLYAGQPLRLVVFDGAVRGNNSFGGKVLTSISCEFNVSDTGASFYNVKQQ